LARDRTYRFSGWFATAGETALPVSKNPVKVKVGLYPEKDFAKPLAEKELTVGSGAFAELTADLPSGIFEGRASFVVSVEPGKGVRIDGLSLQPADNIRGWRRDVIDALKTIKPPIIRFPGGCFASFYDWRDGVGPRIDRRPRESGYWGGLENNDVGVAELVDLCREVGAEPFYCLNVLTGSPAEAADLVAYCNSGPETPLGGLRKGHGFEKPFGIRYWELDNEAYRRFGAAEYAERCVAFAKAIKAVDPEAKLVMIGYWRYNDELARMLEIAGEWVDGVTDRALDERSLRKDLETIGAYNKARQRSLFLCNTEWLAPQTVKEILPGAVLAAGEELSGTLQNKQVRWGYAMTAAAQLLLFQRLGGDFLFANFNNLANTWGQNVIECAKEAVWTSAAGRLFELVTPSPAALPLEHKVVAANPNVLFQAAWDKDKKSLVLEVLNFGRETVQSAFDLKALNFRYREVRMSRLWADSLQAMNSLGNPNGIRRNDDVERGGGGARFTTELPPCSVTLIILSSVMTMGDQKRIER
jgi:alpha-N-arabinofuranosidase